VVWDLDEGAATGDVANLWASYFPVKK
jgi:hypothetical protein